MTLPTVTLEPTSLTQQREQRPNQHFDVVIVGAGLSGIGAACYLQRLLPDKSFTVLEARGSVGGTWDLFRYPGIRSDSDMETLGFSFHPWTSDKSISDGPTILSYIKETAAAFDIEKHIRYHHKLTSAAWSSDEARWRLEVEGAPAPYTCNFLYMCSGYYDYDAGYTPQWPGMDEFKGHLVHPQAWPEDLSVEGKRVVVVGSGATAVTLVPELAASAAHVTMLQRSPSYIAALPAEDRLAKRLHRALPARLAHGLVRWKNVLYGTYVYRMARWQPELVKRSLLKQVQDELGPDYDVEKHFTPRYDPWDQRLCLAPDGDFFKAVKSGRASIVTDEIDTFTSSGLRLASGEGLDADIIVSATGLQLKVVGGAQLSVDGKPVEVSKCLSYKGALYSGLPNFAAALGYTNASWTLKCELISKFVCRLLSYMDAQGYDSCTPRAPSGDLQKRPAVNLTSGYIRRSEHLLPKQGESRPWVIYQSYFQDIAALRYGSLEDEALQYGRRGAAMGTFDSASSAA